MAPTASRHCTSCNAALSAGAAFCHACGAPQRPTSTSRQPPLPWVIGAALVVVVIVAAVSYSAGKSAGARAAASSGSAATGTMAAPDISNMSPEEQANRLFDLVMTAHEQGDVARVNQFLPMALQAYQMLGTLDADQQYHVGLMSAISGNVQEALARVDSIRRVQPNHLLATMLRYSVAQLQSDTAAASAAMKKFARDYQSEIGKNLEEYQAHSRSIESFRQQIQGTTGGS
jgi:hypothetical protein